MTGGAPRLLKGFAALSAGEVIAKVAGFVAFAYLSRVVGSTAYGAVELTVALVTMASLLVDFGLGPVAAADIARHPDLGTPLSARVPAVRLALSLGAFAAVAVTPGALDLDSESSVLVWIFGASLFFHSWNQNWLFQGLGRVSWAAPAQPLRMLSFAIAVILLVSSATRLWIVGIAEVVSVGIMAIYYLAAQSGLGLPVKLTWDWPYCRRALIDATPIAVSQVLWAAGQYLPTVVLAATVSGSEVAWFGSSLRLLLAFHTFVWLYFFNLYPTLVKSSELSGKELESVLRRSFRLTGWAGILGGLIGSLAASSICSLAYGAEFAEAGRVFAILVWVLPIALLSGHARFSLIAYGLQRQELISAAIGVVTTLGICVMLIPHFAAVGAALAVVASSLTVWFSAHWFARRRIPGFVGTWQLAKPTIAGLAALGVGAKLASYHQWMATMTSVMLLLCSAYLLDRTLISDVREWWKAR